MNFQSLTRDVAYEIQKPNSFRDNGFFRHPFNFLHQQFTEYLTYGDGLTQHSPSQPTAKEHFIDALASLASHLLSHPENIESIEQFWPERQHASEIAFYKSLKYDSEKTTYYNTNEQKSSKSEKKKYDRRWEQLPEWADGSIESVVKFGNLNRSYHGAIERFSLYLEIRESFENYPNMEGSGIGSNDRFNDLDYAFRSVDLLVQSFRNKYHAERIFECLKNNWLSLKAKKEEEANTTETEDVPSEAILD